MQRPTREMLVASAIVLCLAAALHLYVWLEPACSIESRRIVMKAAGGVGCFEFWLNRYQSLIGSILTTAIAGATLLWVARQFDASRRQTAIAGATVLRLRVAELNCERALVQRILDLLRQISPAPQDVSGPIPMVALNQVRERLVSGWDELAECLREMQTFDLAGDASLAAAPRKIVLNLLFSMQTNLTLGLAAIAEIQRNGIWQDSPVRDRLYKHWSGNVRRAHEAGDFLRQMDGALRSEIATTLKHIQAFERTAIS